MKRFFSFVWILWSCMLPLSAEKWMVTDETLTIYSDLQYINRLGQVHRGYTFEAQGLEGDMLVFTFNGQKAYAATYCCKQIQESDQPETADKTTKEGVPTNLPPTTKSFKPQDRDQTEPDKSGVPTDSVSAEAGSNASKHSTTTGNMAELMLGILLCLVLIVPIYAICLLWLFRWRKSKLAKQLYNRSLSNAKILWYHGWRNAIALFLVFSPLTIIGWIIGMILWFKYLPDTFMRCPNCHRYWDNVRHTGYQKSGVLTKESNDLKTRQDTRERPDGIDIIDTTTRTYTTQQYQLYRDTFWCTECGEQWYRERKGEQIGSDKVRKKIEEETTKIRF